MTEDAKSRSTLLRERYRRVLLWSFGAAALLHVLVLLFWPGFRAEPVFTADSLSAAVAAGEAVPTYVELLFGPPEILTGDGSFFREERQLETEHLLVLPRECEGDSIVLPTQGKVGLRVWKSGRVDVTALAQGTDDECGDALIKAVAGALWYRWLPSEEFPAPVDLVQPVTVLASTTPTETGNGSRSYVPWGQRSVP